MNVELKVFDPRLEGWGFPHWGSDLAAGLDLFACLEAEIALEPGAAAILIPAGFAMRIVEPGWAAMVYPRSGRGHAGLVLGNSVGVIDADYQGQIMISAWNRSADTIIKIQPGERIAQMVFTHIGRPTFQAVTEFGEFSRRGGGGFGSTG